MRLAGEETIHGMPTEAGWIISRGVGENDMTFLKATEYERLSSPSWQVRFRHRASAGLFEIDLTLGYTIGIVDEAVGCDMQPALQLRWHEPSVLGPEW